MHKIWVLLRFIAHLYITLVLRSKNVYVVCGARRSGNHAMIQWLASSLEGQPVEFVRLGRMAWHNGNGNTIHLNELNWLGLQFVSVIREHKNSIRSASNIIISLEDYVPQFRDPYFPKSAKKISVFRPTLNVCSSRLRRMRDRAQTGMDRGDMSVDDDLVSCLAWALQSHTHGWVRWNYDDWLKNGEWRDAFLKRFGLSGDFAVSPTGNFGGGSSFSNEKLGFQENNPLQRWEHGCFPNRVVSLLYKHRNIILSSDEREFIDSEMNGDPSVLQEARTQGER